MCNGVNFNPNNCPHCRCPYRPPRYGPSAFDVPLGPGLEDSKESAKRAVKEISDLLEKYTIKEINNVR